MNHDDFMYGYQIGQSEPIQPHSYYKKGRTEGTFIGDVTGVLMGGLFDLGILLITSSLKVLLYTAKLSFMLIQKILPKRGKS